MSLTHRSGAAVGQFVVAVVGQFLLAVDTPLAPELVSLIEQMARENPLWSRRRIASELAKLGHAVDKDTVAKYLPKPAPRPAPSPVANLEDFPP